MSKVIKYIMFVLIISNVMIGKANTQVRKSKAIPASSPRLKADSSEFTLLDPRVALRAIEEVREKKDKSKTGELIKAFKENAKRKDGYGPSIQITIIQTLAKFKDKESSRSLIKQLTITNDILFKDEIAYALGETGDKNALTELNKYLNDLLANEPEEPLIKVQWQWLVDRVNGAIKKIEGKPE